MITIIFGLQLTKAGVKIEATYVVYVYIAAFVIFEVVFEIVKMRERGQVEGMYTHTHTLSLSLSLSLQFTII